MKTKKLRKFVLTACLLASVVLCTALGSAFMKDPSASSEGIKTYSSAEDVTETIEASSFSEGVTYESAEGVHFEYNAGYGGFVVTGCTDACTEAYIPDTLTVSVSGKDNSFPVVRVEDEAFYNNKIVTYIRIGRYAEYLGTSAFYYCANCTGLDYFAEDAVSGAGANASVSAAPFGYVGRTYNLLDIFIGENVETIPDGMFAYASCSSITFAEGSRLKKIGDSAFAHLSCSSSTSIPEIRIPDTVESVGDCAFYCVSGEVEALYIPENLTEVGKWAFELKDVDVMYFNAKAFPECDKNLAPFCDLSGSQWSSGNNRFESGKSGTKMYIGRNVTRIPEYCFYGSKSSTAGAGVYISSVYPDCYASGGADDGGYALESIGSYAFSNCGRLSEVVLPIGVKTVEPYAFDGCSYLTSVTLGDTDGWYVTDSNGTKADGAVQYYFGAEFMSDPSTVAKYFKSTYIDYRFCYTDGFSYKLSADGTYYVVSAYTGDGGEVTVRDTYRAKPVKEIGSSAFKSKTAVTSVVIPESVEKIGESAFYGCSSLASVTVKGNGLKEVGSNAFYNCSALKSLYVSSASAFLSVDYDVRYANPLALVSSNKGTFYVGGDSYTTLNINGTDRIGTYALAYCTIISDVVIGESVETIGAYAFYGNTAIKTITIPSSVTEIGAYAFGSMSLETLTFESWSGWTATSGLSSKTFQASELQQGNALNFLTSTYVSYVWTRTATTTAAPTIECSIEDYGYTNGSIFIATGVDESCTILYICYIEPEKTEAEAEHVESSTLTLSSGLIEGTYTFWAVDSEMVESERYHITYDNTPPRLTLDGSVWGNYSGTDFTAIASDSSPVTLYYSTDKGVTWTDCGDCEYTIHPEKDHGSDGVYYFAAKDAAGNCVGPNWITMDTVEPEGYWEKTDDRSLYFTWEAPSYAVWTCTINGKSYTKGATYREETTYTVVLVSNNGEKFEDSYTLEHEYGEPEYVEPTCQEDGYWKYTCIYCGHIETEVDGYSSSGEHNYELVEVPASCTKNGYSQYVCSDCGATTGYTVLYAQGHKWSNSDVSVPATCTTNGFLGQVCDVCGAQNDYGTVIPATGHDWVNDENFYIEATCETRGQSRETCTICGDVRNTVYTAALGHILVTESHSATCTEYGYSKTYCTREGCDYESTDDGDQILAAHSWSSEPLEMVSASCEEEGYVIYVCEVCGEQETVTLNPSGHTWVYSGETTIMGDDGEETAAFLYECSKCGATKVEAYTDAKAAGNAVTEIFEKYQKYLWWILLALVVVWSLFIGLRWALQRNDQEKVKTRSMLANYVLGLFVIAVIIVGLPYLVYGIAILVG